MEDLFDLNDFEDKPEITPDAPTPIAANGIKDKELLTKEEPKIEEKKEKEEDNEDDASSSSGNNENEQNVNTIKAEETNQNILPKLEKKYAIDDNISIEEFNSINPLALKFPFELDDFQKRSIIRLERHENVLVCAHTSSGKTVVAEYGIALGKKAKRRVLYTSPIKALSNQKYREFKKKFGDVGILTGDVSLNPDAQCLIMTTEILQSSLYKNSELLNSVEWVVFDEVHYINDKERGHVWEEILILLPKQIGIIMLSATVPNYLQFAQWVGRIKNTTIYVQNTLKRVVPLEHKLFVDSNNVFLAKDKDDNVFDTNVKKAIKSVSIIKKKQQQLEQVNKFKYKKKNKEQEFFDNITWYNQFRGKGKKKQSKGKPGGNPNFVKITNMHFKIEEIVDYLAHEEKTPAVIFVFSIKKINEYAKMLSLKQLTTKSEQNQILQFFNKCMNTLPEEDRMIPQIQEMREILKSGIGVHHSGLLPILKETIEILYSKGLIKILFATTSFSIGLNMPTRTVVFTEIYKFNDERKEILSSSEYLQMCGRAGRRGIDTIGNVFMLLTDKTSQDSDAEEIINMLKGKGTEVESKFRLCYRTIIAFLARNIKEINEFFKESFLENINIQSIPQVKKDIEDLTMQLNSMDKINCFNESDDKLISNYLDLCEQLKSNNEKLFSFSSLKQKLRRGAIIKIRDYETQRNMIVMVVRFYENYDDVIWCINASKSKTTIEYENENDNNKKKGKKKQKFDQTAINGTINNIHYEYKLYYLKNIIEIYKKPITDIQLHNDILKTDDDYEFLNKNKLTQVIERLVQINSDPIQLENLKVINYTKIINRDSELTECLVKKDNIQKELSESKCSGCALLNKDAMIIHKRKTIEKAIKDKTNLLNPENMAHYYEFKTRMEILKKMNYVDEHGLTLKGKAAREIATTDCVLISELLLSNILDTLPNEEIVAFLSGFASNKSEIEFMDPGLSKEFSTAYNKFEQIYEQLTDTEHEINEFEENKYNRRLTFSISKAMKAWMMNKPFNEILRDTDLEEGKLYNLIMRIYLFLEEIINFYGVLGNMQLVEKYTHIKTLLLRGIMSIQSLYLQDKIDID